MKNFLPPERTGTATNATSITRAVLGLARNTDADAAGVVRRTWPNDRQAVELAERSTTNPIGPGNTGAAFASTVLADVIAFVTPSSGFGYLLSHAIPVSFLNSVSAVRVPTINSSLIGMQFVLPGEPIPAWQGSLAGPILTPRKVAIISAMTRELMESSNAETMLRQVLGEDIKLGGVRQMLDATADNEIRPAGLRNGVTALTAAAASATAMADDLTALGAAVAVVAGDLSNIVYITDAATALRISIGLPLFKPTVLASSALLPGEIVTLAINALCIGAGDGIKFSTSKETVLHLEDETPAADVMSASPTRSLFQTDSVAVRLIFDLSWAMRVPSGAVAWLQANW